MPYPPIVTENVSALLAPTPSTLQSTGAMISQGATTLASGTYSLLTQKSDLTALLAAPLALTSLTWSGGVVVATTVATIPGNLSSGDTFITTIAGVTPSGYNGLVLATVTGTSTFTYPLAANPGTETVSGTYTPPNQGELQAMVNTFYGQGTSQAVYVLELGAGGGTAGPTALGTFLTANPGTFYSFLVPRLWDARSTFLSLIAEYEALSSKLYFFVTTTTANYTNYTAVMKNVVTMVEAPALPLTEFSLAADFQHTLAYAPSSSNRMTQNGYAYLYGVTAYPTVGNNALLQALRTASVNFVGTGAEGGLSDTLMMYGTTMDGNDFTWWYAADWVQVNCNQAASAAVIQGSNNPINPLYYNQGGINTLQNVIVGTMADGIAYGLLNGTVTQTALDPITFGQNLDNGVYSGQNVVNAVPFPIYTKQNPAAYGQRNYGGFTVVAIPMNGFGQIVFNVLVTNLIGSL